MYIKLTNGVPERYSVWQLCRDNPQVSFPKNIPDATLAEYGVFPLTPTDQPSYDPVTQSVIEGTAVLVSDEWVQVWDIIENPAEEIQGRIESQAQAVRMEREQLLKDTDWVVIKSLGMGQSVPAELELYRQQLRDIPEQEGFPFNVTWPTKP